MLTVSSFQEPPTIHQLAPISRKPLFAPSCLMVYFAAMDTDKLLIITTAPDDEISERIATALVEPGLAACVNILPGIRSIYQWGGKLESGREQLLLIKAEANAYMAIEKQIEALHPYELPEIIALSIDRGLPAYLDWVGGRMPSGSH